MIIKKLKTIAIAMLVTGATATSTRVLAGPITDTNTYTNVVQDVTVSLTVYSNSPIKSLTSQTGGKTVTITTKSILTALSNASANIPAFEGFVWGKSPSLVLNTVFSTEKVISNTVTVVSNFTVTLSNETDEIVFQPTNDVFPSGGGTILTISNTNAMATITNADGTNTIAVNNGNFSVSADTITNSDFSYLSTNGGTNASPTFPTNVGVWTVITATTNSSNDYVVTATTYTNVPHITGTNYSTNSDSSSIFVEGGTATAPVFADVSSFISGSPTATPIIITATGTGLGTTNSQLSKGSTVAISDFSLKVYNTDASTAVGNNLELEFLRGFGKGTFDNDVLKASKTSGTNIVPVTASTYTVSGHGYIGGFYVTNTSGTNEYGLPVTEYTGIGSVTNTNTISGIITNPIPVVVEGTITVGTPKSVSE